MTQAQRDNLPDFSDVVAAADRIDGLAHRTPVARSRQLDSEAGATVSLKCENLQRAGAFKFRGAYNAMSRLTDTDRARGVLTFSSGNHAQAIALAGKLLDIGTTVIMPHDAPAMKKMATEGYGATVIEHEPDEVSRENLAAEVQESSGAVLIPPFDHPHVIAGQGTATMELIDEVGDLDWLLVPCGGGGLLSGSALAARHLTPGCRVVGIEPEAGDDATRSFHSGVLQTVENPVTIADGTRTPSLGELTFPLILDNVDDMVTVPEAEIVRAVVYLFTRLKLVVEPSGALPIAALLSGAVTVHGKVGVILSGGNMDPAFFAGLVS